jgi:hypothetical protein
MDAGNGNDPWGAYWRAEMVAATHAPASRIVEKVIRDEVNNKIISPSGRNGSR